MKDCIEYIRNNAIDFPDRIAVVEGGVKISYSKLNSMINSISHELRLINEHPKVIFDLPQSINAYALILSVLNIGGTFCPLNIESPIERKRQIINEYQPDLIVLESDNQKHNYDGARIATVMELMQENVSPCIEDNYDPESIIYVIYTSGSTGAPKGVMICRKALNKFLEWSIPTYGAGGNDIWGQFSYLSFDLSIVDIFSCLCSGATLLTMANRTSKMVPSSIISASKITIWHSVPSVVDFMIEREKSKEADLSSLRLMSFCGEPLRKHHLDYLFKKNSKLTIFNTYGPTEGTLFCTYQELRIDNYYKYCAPTFSIGKPIPGWNISFNPTEDASLKEIVIYGDYIGKGYLARVEDAKFRIIEIEGKKWQAFETGDLVTEKDGDLYFSSRKDRQIKIKGYRIEPEEIDSLITEILHAPSMTIMYNNELYSFIETELKIDVDNLKIKLSSKIESYKIPRSFIAVKKFPRNVNFKINVTELLQLIV